MTHPKSILTIALACALSQISFAQATPVFGFQNGFSPRKGEFYLHTGNFVNNHFHAGVSDFAELGVGIVTQALEGVGLSLSLKFRLLETQKFHWSAGAYGAQSWNGGYEPQQYWNLYSAATWGSRLNYAGLSAGWLHNRFWGYYSGGDGLLAPAYFILNGLVELREIGLDLADNDAPFVGLHFRRSGKNTSGFIAECFYFPYGPGGRILMLSPGVEIWNKPRLKFDVALTMVIATLPNGEQYVRPLFVLNAHFGIGKSTRALWAGDLGK